MLSFPNRSLGRVYGKRILSIKRKKETVQVVRRNEDAPQLGADTNGEKVKVVTFFKYLGSYSSEDVSLHCNELELCSALGC